MSMEHGLPDAETAQYWSCLYLQVLQKHIRADLLAFRWQKAGRTAKEMEGWWKYALEVGARFTRAERKHYAVLRVVGRCVGCISFCAPCFGRTPDRAGKEPPICQGE
jgi:hypothetical protein